MARFPNAVTSDQAAINYAADAANLQTQCTPLTISATGTTTLTAAQFLNGVINITAGAVATTVNTPTAAAIVAALNPTGQPPNAQVNWSWPVVVQNRGTGTMTWGLGTGVTARGIAPANLPTNTSMAYMCLVTNITVGSEAVQMLSFAATPWS